MTRTLVAAAAVLLAASPAAAGPQTEPIKQDAQSLAKDVQEAVIPTGKRYEAKPSMLSLQAGAGLSDFRGALNNNIDPGVSWDLRAGYRNDKLVGGELAFTGAVNGTSAADNDLGPRVNHLAVTNMGDAQARINFTTDEMWQPYVAGGVGVLVMDVRDADTIVKDGTAATLPLSVGLQMYTKSRITAGARLNYRVLTDVLTNDIPSGDQWNVGLNVGAVF
jgi:opacity protein-like surface antigen